MFTAEYIFDLNNKARHDDKAEYDLICVLNDTACNVRAWHHDGRSPRKEWAVASVRTALALTPFTVVNTGHAQWDSVVRRIVQRILDAALRVVTATDKVAAQEARADVCYHAEVLHDTLRHVIGSKE